MLQTFGWPGLLVVAAVLLAWFERAIPEFAKQFAEVPKNLNAMKSQSGHE